MEKLKNKRLYTIVAVLLVIAIVITVAIILSLSGQDAISQTLNLGDRYLSNMDYESAIRQYGRVLSVDPSNEDALAGLVMSYIGLGDNETAKEIFEDHLSDTKRTDVLEAYGEMLEEEGDYVAAAGIVKELISIRDADEDYAWLDEIVSKVMTTRHDYSEGPSTTIELWDGQVNTMGNNELGALGTTTALGVDSVTETMASADFMGNAAAVYSFGANSVVIDESGAMWLAGSNRSGQRADGSTQMIATGGWSQIASPDGTIVKAAGFDGTIFALTEDGSLWVVGQNGGYVNGRAWLEHWTLVSGYGRVLDLQYSQNAVAFLNEDGTVYRSYAAATSSSGYVTAGWNVAARGVSHFSLNSTSITWCESSGRLYSENWYIDYPQEWVFVNEYGYTDGYKTPFTVRAIADVNGSLFVLSDDGILHYAANGVDREIAAVGTVEDIYTSGSSCVVELQGGGYLLFDSEGNQK